MKNRPWTLIFSAAGMCVLILDAKTAWSGATEGLDLCIRSVVPSLFPFLVLSVLLTGTVGEKGIPILRPVGRLVGIPQGAESLLIVGLLGGYPVGAQAVAHLYRNGQISRSSARRLLGFSNNAGPAFLFGIVAPQFTDLRTAWILWGIHVASALAVGFLLPGKIAPPVSGVKGHSMTLPAAVRQGVIIMGQICGWVVLFRVMITYLNRWIFWLLPESACIILSGFMELTNGCCQLSVIHSEPLRFIAASAMLSFGGFCVCMQTASVTEGIGLGLYLPGKLLQTLISVILAVFLLRPRVLPPVILAVIGITCRELKKRSGNSSSVGV